MSSFPSLERVIVVPRNGYANRLQAWASSAILAAQLDVCLRVLWEPEEVAPAEADALFASSVITRQFIAEDDFRAIVGRPHALLPRHLSYDPDRGVIVLAGHDRGEQAFIPELQRMLDDDTRAHTLVIIAGGRFHLPGDEDFVRQRSLFYQGLQWSSVVEARVAQALDGRAAFAGLHIRETDRSLEAPTPRTIRAGLRRLRERQGDGPLFVAADTVRGRDRWTAEAAALGFDPWSMSDVDLDRTAVGAGVDAVADWRVLAHAEAIVYPAASTFSEEASVASGHHDRAIPLGASASRRHVRAWGMTAHDVLTYPRRRWRIRNR